MKEKSIWIAASFVSSTAAVFIASIAVFIALIAQSKAFDSEQIRAIVRDEINDREQLRVARYNEALNHVRRDMNLPPHDANTYDELIEGFLEVFDSVSGG